MRHEYTALQTRYEKVHVNAEALLDMSIQYLQDMVQQANGITDDGKYIASKNTEAVIRGLKTCPFVMLLKMTGQSCASSPS